MLDKILEALRINGPLPASILLSICEGITIEQLLELADADELTLLEFERPDDGVYLVFSHPKARFRCRNFR